MFRSRYGRFEKIPELRPLPLQGEYNALLWLQNRNKLR
jgi:hypothetical protein